MGNATTKQIGKIDGDQALRKAYNVEDSTLSVNGFIVGKIGHKVIRTVITTNVTNDTEVYTFMDNSVVLYVIEIVYATSDLETMLSVERVG